MAVRILSTPSRPVKTAHQTFTLLPDPTPAYAPVLIDARVPIITLVRALAAMGLRLAYDSTRDALTIQVAR